MQQSKDLLRLVYSNELPNPGESVVIKQQLDDLESQIAGLEAQLEDLKEQKRVRRAVLSVTRRIPAEILGEIFLLLTPHILDSHSRNALLDVGLVCRSWRDALLATHGLWSGVQVDMPTIGTTSATYGKIVSWLARSGGLPKSLVLHSKYAECGCGAGGACHSSNPVLRQLLMECPALHHLTLWCQSPRCLNNWLAAARFSVNSLQLIFGEGKWTDSPSDASVSGFRGLPPVESLQLDLPDGSRAFPGGVSIFSGIHISPQILTNLKSLTINCDWEGTQVVDVLRYCTRLETLKVAWADEQQPPRQPIVLANLRTLRLQNAERFDFLRYIQTPKLKNLDLELTIGSEDTWVLPSRDLGDFIATSNLKNVLETLRICGFSTIGDSLAWPLDRLSSLRHLTLDNVAIPDLDAFWDTVWSKGNGPRLRTLELLEVPDEYPFEKVIDLFNRLPQGVRCNVTVSYSEEGRKSRWAESYFQNFHLWMGRSFWKLIPSLSAKE